MAGRTERILIFEDTMKMCETNDRLLQSVQMSLENQVIYWEDDELNLKPERKFSKTKLVLSPKRTCEAARDYKEKHVCILNFASYVTPGGGVVRGTTAQEESICRITTLYKGIADNSVRVFYDCDPPSKDSETVPNIMGSGEHSKNRIICKIARFGFHPSLVLSISAHFSSLSCSFSTSAHNHSFRGRYFYDKHC